jgi:plastocyanin
MSIGIVRAGYVPVKRLTHCWPLVLLVAALQSVAAADLNIVVEDAHSRALPEAVLYLTGGSGGPSRAARTAEVDQRHRQFMPRITVVQTGTAITFPNNDTIRHSVYSFSRPKPFELKLFAGKVPAPIIFDKPGVVILGCNIHDDMSAWILVVDTTLFGKADADGRFVFHDLRPGTYELFAWYPSLTAAVSQQTIVVDSRQARELRVHLNVMPIEAETQP